MKLRLANWLRILLRIPRNHIRCKTSWETVMELDPRELVQREILYKGNYEPQTSECMLGLLQPGNTFLDIGAHVGYYTLAGANRVGPAGKVIAVEPNPRTFVQLRDNVHLNPELKNINLFLGAASSTSGMVPMNWPPDGNWGISSTTTKERLEFTISSTPLSELVEYWKLDRIDVIKVDVESHELPTLRGLFSRLKPRHIFFEVNHPHDPHAVELLDYLTKEGYRLRLVNGQPYDRNLPIPENNLWAEFQSSAFIHKQSTLGVLLTYHNEGKLLTECLNSLHSQKNPPDEILIYDDGSQDPPEPYIPNPDLVKVLKGKLSRGPSFGRNALLEASTSDYIHFHDSDDWFEPGWAVKIRAAMEGETCDVILNEIAAYTDGKKTNDRILDLKSLKRHGDLILYCLRGVPLPAGGTYRRQKAQEVGGYRVSVWQSEDMDFHLRLALRNPNYTVITEPLSAKRNHPNSRSEYHDESHRDIFNILESLEAEIPHRYRSEIAERAYRSACVLFRAGYREDAKRGFALAAEWGPPPLHTFSWHYRLVARLIGLVRAEKIGGMYRKLIPNALRKLPYAITPGGGRV